MSLPPYPISFTGNFAVFLPYVAELARHFALTY